MDDKKRMDRFDSIVVEYHRKHPNLTMSDIAERIGCNTTSLWRYRKQELAFTKAPFETICAMLRMANVSVDVLRYICGWGS